MVNKTDIKFIDITPNNDRLHIPFKDTLNIYQK